MTKPPKPASPDRRARLAEELRRNLKKRKVQDRARSAGDAGNGAEADGEDSRSPDAAPDRTIPNRKA